MVNGKAIAVVIDRERIFPFPKNVIASYTNLGLFIDRMNCPISQLTYVGAKKFRLSPQQGFENFLWREKGSFSLLLSGNHGSMNIASIVASAVISIWFFGRGHPNYATPCV